VSDQLGATDYDVVRTYLFGSYPVNCDERDDEYVESQKYFYSRLKEEYHYEVETYPINFRGNRLRRQDRSKNDKFEPKEKCVDISLATSMLYFAAIPYAYDIAIAVLGDLDFKPVLQHVRRLGKRVAIASVKSNCAAELSDSTDQARVKDFDIIWLDDLLDKLELKFERTRLECESPLHSGSRSFYSDYRPRRGDKVFCPDCRKKFRQQKQESFKQYVSRESESDDDNATLVGQTLTGTVYEKKDDRGFGFINAAGREYYFHLMDLQDLDFNDIEERKCIVDFEVSRDPTKEKAGAASNVRKHL
jgi:cold shock CspA family protein